MLYSLEIEKSLAERIRELDDEETLIVNAIEWYLDNMEPKKIGDDDRSRINPRLCSVLDNEVLQIVISGELWARLKAFSDKNRLRVHNVIKEAIREFIFEHYTKKGL
jgi:predicted DNA-binding protein